MPDGRVHLTHDQGTAGMVSDLISVAPGGLLRVSLLAELDQRPGHPRPQIRAEDATGRPVTPLTPLSDGSTELFAFVSHRTQVIRLHVIAGAPQLDSSLRLAEVRVEAVDPESYYLRQRHRSLAPALASVASIPGRSAMLRDCIDSLLVQCDEIRVFLNGYPEIPTFLRHPRIEVRRSEDWDDKGDAGKFAWVEEPAAPGYRFIVDDDLIFPPDFVRVLSAAVNSHDNRALVGMHGVLLKQPIERYYDPGSRSVFHFESALDHERTVHVLGTNALCYHSDMVRMRWDDFMYSNMADIFLARYAQDHRLPMVSPARPQHWVRQNAQTGDCPTIYDHSLDRTRSRFDSSFVQDAVVRWIAPLTLQPTRRQKIVLVLIATSRANFEAALASFEHSCSTDYDWVLLVTAGVDDEALRQHVATTQSKHEVHLVDTEHPAAAGRIDRAMALVHGLDWSATCIAVDTIRFQDSRWARRALRLCTGHEDHGVVVRPSATTTPAAAAIGRHLGAQAQPPAAILASRRLFDGLCLDDTQGATGLSALRDWAQRMVADSSGAPPISHAEAEALAETLAVREPGRAWLDAEASDAQADRVGARPPTSLRHRSVPLPALTIPDFFDRVLVINLERRPDRWERVCRRLEAVGVTAERFRAVDGTWPEVAAEYEEYALRPLVPHPTGVRRVDSSREFFLDYDSQTARVAYAEHEEGRKAIQSSGAWAYLKTWEQILERVLDEQIPRTLVLDDDVLFHRHSAALFAAAVGSLPSDWLLLQLGSLQYHWSEDWITFHNRVLYHTNGAVVGSHAVGLHQDVAPYLLELVKRMQLPFDTGALAAANRAFKRRSFVVYPNIAMQDLSDGSDINTSRFQQEADHQAILATYRWDLEGVER